MNPERFLKNPKITFDKLQQALQFASQRIEYYLDEYGTLFPSAASKDNFYVKHENNQCWTEGFYTGMIILSYEYGSTSKLKDKIIEHVASFKKRLAEKAVLDHHDIGFLYSLSCVAAYKVLGDEEAKLIALKAADWLLTRYCPKGKFIQAWGNMEDKSNYRLIIDCYMNIPLLFWAYEVTGDEKYKEVAYSHALTALDVVIRDDSSTHHTYFFNKETYTPLKGVTAQGYSDESAWARGQAWGIYGFPLVYSYTKDIRFMEAFYKVTNYFINRLPDDQIPYWDLIFTDGDNQPKDSSSASIAVCGILEAIPYIEDKTISTIYQGAADGMMRSLISNYVPQTLEESDGLLYHAVYSLRHDNGVDECNIWGDYFYMEALTRMTKQWNKYW